MAYVSGTIASSLYWEKILKDPNYAYAHFGLLHRHYENEHQSAELQVDMRSLQRECDQ